MLPKAAGSTCIGPWLKWSLLCKASLLSLFQPKTATIAYIAITPRMIQTLAAGAQRTVADFTEIAEV